MILHTNNLLLIYFFIIFLLIIIEHFQLDNNNSTICLFVYICGIFIVSTDDCDYYTVYNTRTDYDFKIMRHFMCNSAVKICDVIQMKIVTK